MRLALCALLLLLSPALQGIASAGEDETAESPTGLLRFRVVDAETAEPIPARVTVIDDRGRSHIAPAAVPVAGECMEPAPEGWATAAEGGLPKASLFDPATGARAFYVSGPVQMEVPRGRYRITATRGFEWEERSVPVEVFSAETGEVPIRMRRWIDMPARGWVSSDGHLHISRPSKDLDPLVATWMDAEDLHVANLLQMGRHAQVLAARQYAFGAAGRYRDGSVVLAPGQENPRTWLIGHGMVYGAPAYLDPGDRYLVYQPVWRRAQAGGGLSGYAHWLPPGALIDAPTGLVDFLEVLQFDTPNYEMLYRLWGLGLVVTPIAGTDFPCIGDLPGADRFYTRVTPPFSWERWLEGVRRGRTFVTNGPLLELEVEGAGIGDRVRLESPGTVRVAARARFDATRDDVRVLELVQDGEVVGRATRPSGLGRIELSVEVPFRRSGWLALRSSGIKLDRRPHGDRPRESAAHTGAVVVRVAGTPPLGTGPAVRGLARAAVEEMRAMRELFSDEDGKALLQRPKWLRGVDLETFRESRPGLLAELDVALAWYASRVRGAVPTDLAAFEGSPGFRRLSRTPGGASRRRP